MAAVDIESRRRALGLVRGEDGRLSRQAAPASSAAAELGAAFLRIGNELLSVPAPRPAPMPAPPAVLPAPPTAAEPAPQGDVKAWVLKTRDLYGGGMRTVRMEQQPDGAWLLKAKDGYGNPRLVKMRPER